VAYRAEIARLIRTLGRSPFLAHIILGTLLRSSTDRLCALTACMFAVPPTRTTDRLLARLAQALDRLDDFIRPPRHTPAASAAHPTEDAHAARKRQLMDLLASFGLVDNDRKGAPEMA
jgi:hypothetical protein